MNWDAIGAVGEILGALGVIVTLAYLAIQVRASTRATDSQALVGLSAEMENVLLAGARGDRLFDAMLRAERGDELPDRDVRKLTMWFGAVLRMLESHFLQRKLKATGVGIDVPVGNLLRVYADNSVFRGMMQWLVRNEAASPDFVAWLDAEILQKLPPDIPAARGGRA